MFSELVVFPYVGGTSENLCQGVETHLKVTDRGFRSSFLIPDELADRGYSNTSLRRCSRMELGARFFIFVLPTIVSLDRGRFTAVAAVNYEESNLAASTANEVLLVTKPLVKMYEMGVMKEDEMSEVIATCKSKSAERGRDISVKSYIFFADRSLVILCAIHACQYRTALARGCQSCREG